MSSLNPDTESHSQSQTRCRLEENLPVELHIAILLRCPDLETLQALVQASPAYHAAYRTVREQALFQALCAEYYGMESVDAIVALRSRGLYADIPSNKEKIYALLDQWRRHKEIRRLNLPSAKNLPDTPANLDEVFRLIRLHKIMKFCVNDFGNAMGRLLRTKSEVWNHAVLPISLCRTEKTRLLRGLYRVQIYANIFGRRVFYPSREEPPQENYNLWEDKTFKQQEVWQIFISAMAPWEYYEYRCARQYIYERYRKPYQEIGDYFAQSLEEKYQIDPLPTNCPPPPRFDSVRDVRRNRYSDLCGLSTRGPVFFYKFICEPSFLRRRDIILVNPKCPFDSQEVWPDRLSNPYPLLCPGFESTDDFPENESLRAILSPTDRPNIALERLYFVDDSRAALFYLTATWGGATSWGHAIWDDERLIEWKRQLFAPFSTPLATRAAEFRGHPWGYDYIFELLPWE